MDSNAVVEVVARAEAFAQQNGSDFDASVGKKAATNVIRKLTKGEEKEKKLTKEEGKEKKLTKEEEKKTDDAPDTPEKQRVDKKDNILIFSEAELDTLAVALVNLQNGNDLPNPDDFIQDFSSPSLDIAAFGRMFANRSNLSTQAAVAVSHAVTTHEMSLTIDYFTAVDDLEDEKRTDAGASHLGLTYYTSGVYYSTFTIDPAQLKRSWSGFNSPTARNQVAALAKALVEALPTGKLTNTNAHTKPFLVLVEKQKGRTVYEFETPVEAGPDGGYKQASIDSLARQYALARQYDANNYLESMVFGPGATDQFPGSNSAASIDDIASAVVADVFGGE